MCYLHGDDLDDEDDDDSGINNILTQQASILPPCTPQPPDRGSSSPSRESQQHSARTRLGQQRRTLIPSQITHSHAKPMNNGDMPSQDTELQPQPIKNHYIGDVLALPKPVNTTRVYFQNINGISLTTPGTWDITCQDLRDMQVDLALFVEHKLDSTQARVIKRLHDDTQKVFSPGTYSLTATSTPIQAQSMYKPGGALALTQGGLKGRLLASGSDYLGRWIYLTLRRNIGPPVTVITTYQVVDTDPRRAGPTTYATQLYASYISEQRQHPEKLRYHHAQDLVDFMQTCHTKGEWVIVAGDFNEVMGATTQGLTRLHSECSLIDAVLDKHGETDFTTYQRGQSVIDYNLVDRNIFRCIQAVGYEPFLKFPYTERSQRYIHGLDNLPMLWLQHHTPSTQGHPRSFHQKIPSHSTILRSKIQTP